MESRCILLDESFANLDHEAAAQLLEMLLRMKTSGRTILAIDHKADLWLEAADEIILLEEGGKVAVRGINCKNLPEHRADFERLGLFYPGSRPERAARPVAEGKPLLQFRGVSIRKGLPTRPQVGPHGVRRTLSGAECGRGFPGGLYDGSSRPQRHRQNHDLSLGAQAAPLHGADPVSGPGHCKNEAERAVPPHRHRVPEPGQPVRHPECGGRGLCWSAALGAGPLGRGLPPAGRRAAGSLRTETAAAVLALHAQPGPAAAGWRFFRCWQVGRNCYCWTNPPTARMPAR